VARTRNYQVVCQYLTSIQRLYQKPGKRDTWTSYIAALREQHRHLPALRDELAKAYSSSLSTYCFLQHALEKSSEATGLEQEIVELIGKVQTAYQTLAELHTKLDELAQEFLHT
jgi:hypothetical protein